MAPGLANSAINAVINGTANINPYSFEIITNVGPLSLAEQEFLIQTPKPSTLALMVCGVLVLAFVAFARARLSA